MQTDNVVAQYVLQLDNLVEKYIAVRDKKQEIDKAHKGRMAEYARVMDKIEALILDHFTKTGQDSAKTQHGTAYKSTQTSVKVADRDAFLAFVMEDLAEREIFLESKANKTAVDAWLTEKQELPPGVNVTRINTVNIRRS
jgi:hypothetical protein